MDVTKAIESASDAVRKLWEKHGVKEPLRFLGFCLSMLPIPVIQQSGQALDRHLSDKAFKSELEAIWGEIKNLNGAVSSIDSVEQAIPEIAKTIEANATISNRVHHFLANLGLSQREFSVLTENNSYQELVNSIVHADVSTFSARGGSTNVLSNLTINSNVTQLHATDNSKNLVDRTSFQGVGGATSMNKIVTQGPIQVQGSSVGFGPGGSIGFGEGGMIGFGPNPFEVTGTCPHCNTQIRADKRQLMGYSSIQCPGCKMVLPFDPKGI